MSEAVHHVYQVYIRTTPDQLWDAITNPDKTEHFFFGRFESDWKPGSRLILRDPADDEIMLDNVIISVDKPRKLVHTFRPTSANAQPSKVTWSITPMDDVCLLEVTHEFTDLALQDAAGTQRGWPKVLSGLKTFLETGKPLDIPDATEAAVH
jgi:uncharacterized protein YndB with AHSA1/START domain